MRCRSPLQHALRPPEGTLYRLVTGIHRRHSSYCQTAAGCWKEIKSAQPHICVLFWFLLHSSVSRSAQLSRGSLDSSSSRHIPPHRTSESLAQVRHLYQGSYVCYCTHPELERLAGSAQLSSPSGASTLSAPNEAGATLLRSAYPRQTLGAETRETGSSWLFSPCVVREKQGGQGNPGSCSTEQRSDMTTPNLLDCS